MAQEKLLLYVIAIPSYGRPPVTFFSVLKYEKTSSNTIIVYIIVTKKRHSITNLSGNLNCILYWTTHILRVQFGLNINSEYFLKVTPNKTFNIFKPLQLHH